MGRGRSQTRREIPLGGDAVARHLEHAVNVAGEDHVALGSDWDGAIVTPAGAGDILAERAVVPVRRRAADRDAHEPA